MPTLENVVAAFEAWRAKRTSRQEPIPQSLWDMAKTLLPHYSKSQVQKALRISHAQFQKNYLPVVASETDIRHQQDAFAVASWDTAPGALLKETAHKDTPQDTVELILTGGRKTLQIKLTQGQLPTVLAWVEPYL